MSLYEEYMRDKRRDIISNLPYKTTLDMFEDEVIIQSNPREIIFEKIGLEMRGENILVKYRPRITI